MRVCIIKMLEWKLKCWRRMIFDFQPEVDELATRQRRVLTLPALPGEWGLGDRLRFFVNLLDAFLPMSAVFLSMSAALLLMSAVSVPISAELVPAPEVLILKNAKSAAQRIREECWPRWPGMYSWKPNQWLKSCSLRARHTFDSSCNSANFCKIILCSSLNRMVM